MGRYRKIAWTLVLTIVLGATLMKPAEPQALQGRIPFGEEGAMLRGSKEFISSRTTPIGKKTTISDAVPHIFNGSEAPQYQYVVGISFLKNGREGTCTGTLLGKRLVLTAAHCGCGTSYSVTQELRMASGKFRRVIDPPILFDSLICQRSAIRPGYDLALLRLAEDADVADDYDAVPPLAFSLGKLTRTGTDLIVVGYGLTESRTSGVRMQASVPVFTADCAQRQYVAAGCAPFLEMILSASARTSGSRTADTCSGDSGGPVFAMRSIQGGVAPVLVGVTSRPAPFPHIDAEDHCGGGGFYTVVGRTDVITWLQNNGAMEKPAPQGQTQ